MEKTYSVYKHTFPDGKVYIGITSLKPEKRWNKGKGYRRKKNHRWCQPRIAKAVGKHDWDTIKHEILCEGLSKAEACAMEQALITEYRSDDIEYGYNEEKGGGV